MYDDNNRRHYCSPRACNSLLCSVYIMVGTLTLLSLFFAIFVRVRSLAYRIILNSMGRSAHDERVEKQIAPRPCSIFKTTRFTYIICIVYTIYIFIIRVVRLSCIVYGWRSSSSFVMVSRWSYKIGISFSTILRNIYFLHFKIMLANIVKNIFIM